MLLLGVAGCGGGRDADPLYGVWNLTRVTGGFVGNGRPVVAGESLTLSANRGTWRRGDGTQESFTYHFETHAGKRVLAREGTGTGLIVEEETLLRLTLQEQVSDAYTFELTR